MNDMDTALVVTSSSRLTVSTRCCCISPLHVLEQVLEPRKRLHARRQDLVCRQHKSIASRVPKLARERKLDLGHVASIVDTAARRLVDRAADRAIVEHRSIHCLDRGHRACGKRLVLGVVGRHRRARVAVRRHEQLRVRVVVDEHLDSVGRSERVEVRRKHLRLWRVALGRSLEVLGTRVRRGASGHVPHERPVAVDVVAEAGAASGRLAVLAPQALRGLGVAEAVRVDDGDDVEVVLVDQRLDGRVGGIVGQKVPSKVLGHHGRDPFAGVHGAVQDDGGLLALACRAPEVDASDVAALQGGADTEDLGVGGVGFLQVGEESQVVGVGVVAVKPVDVGGLSCGP
jgi:hypothetical protein